MNITYKMVTTYCLFREDNIQCPYHNWSFKGTTGECTDIPYSSGCIPKAAKLKTYQSVERNGFIYVWYHADGEAPSWEVPVEEAVETNNWSYQGRTEYYVNCNAQDMSENPADNGHLNSVHDTGTDTDVLNKATFVTLELNRY